MNHYSRAIEILATADPHDLLFRIAARNPSVIVKAFNTKLDPEGALKKACIDLYRSGRKIDAVKRWRAETGASLLEAKNAVEALYTSSDSPSR